MKHEIAEDKHGLSLGYPLSQWIPFRLSVCAGIETGLSEELAYGPVHRIRLACQMIERILSELLIRGIKFL
jgi:hypothetical protein